MPAIENIIVGVKYFSIDNFFSPELKAEVELAKKLILILIFADFGNV